jgi:hypothetical protein
MCGTFQLDRLPIEDYPAVYWEFFFVLIVQTNREYVVVNVVLDGNFLTRFINIPDELVAFQNFYHYDFTIWNHRFF